MISIILISPTKKRDGDLKFYFCSNPSAVKSNILAGGKGYLGTEEPHLVSRLVAVELKIVSELGKTYFSFNLS